MMKKSHSEGRAKCHMQEQQDTRGTVGCGVMVLIRTVTWNFYEEKGIEPES